MSTEQGQARPSNPTRWVDVLPSHDLVLTHADVEGALAGAVFSIEAEFGPNGRVPMSVERRRDGTWTVHGRAYVRSEALIGGKATPRRRVSRLTGEDIPRDTGRTGERERTSFTEATTRMREVP